LTGSLGDAAAWPRLHSQAGADARGDAVGAGEQLALAIVESIANVLADLPRQVEEELALFGVDSDAAGEAGGVARFGDGMAAGIVQVELDLQVTLCVCRDVQDHLAGRSVKERDRCTRASVY
jgi:hypothetical protein